MNIIELFQTFQTQEQAVEYLEKVRWNNEPVCPYCGSLSVGKHASGDRSIARWQCRDCTRAFAVTVGTLFHGTHIPLRNWFLVLALMLNAKKSASAYQIARDLDMRRPTVWSMMQRIRTAMAADPDQDKLLHGIVEADETYTLVGNRARAALRAVRVAAKSRSVVEAQKRCRSLALLNEAVKLWLGSRSPVISRQRVSVSLSLDLSIPQGRF